MPEAPSPATPSHTPPPPPGPAAPAAPVIAEARDVGPGPVARLFYLVCVHLCEIIFTIFFRLRHYGRERVPTSGPLLVVMNHQSYFDPAVAGVGVRPRPLAFLARHTLFFPAFGALIRALNAIPLNQEGSDTAAIKTALQVLKGGRSILIFPEGSRTKTGSMHLFKRGAWLLMSRAKCPILPVAIEGAYDAFPRGKVWPRIGRPIGVMVGAPIAPETLKALDPDAGLRMLRDRIETLRAELAQRMTHAGAKLSTKPAVETFTD